MNENILVISGSPQGKKGNSEAIADYLIERLNKEKLNTSKFYLSKEINKHDNSIISEINKSDVTILCLPMYENSVPGLVLHFFEEAYKEKDNSEKKERKFLVVTNSGFPEVNANKYAIETCRLFAKSMGVIWMGGVPVAPGTLIDGKKLETAKSYKRLITSLNMIIDSISKDIDIPQKAFEIMEKPFINPFIYRLIGKMMQKPAIKKLGKDKYFPKPFELIK